MLDRLRALVTTGAVGTVTWPNGSTGGFGIYALKYEGNKLIVYAVGQPDHDYQSTVVHVTENNDTGDIDFLLDNGIIFSVNRVLNTDTRELLDTERDTTEPPQGMLVYEGRAT